MPVAVPPSLADYTRTACVVDAPHASVWDAVGPEGRVALKVPHTEAARAALAREDAVLSRLRLPGLVERTAGGPAGAWMATRWIDGEPADAWARGRSIPEIVSLAARLAETLAALHAVGLAHGDVKPGNVVVHNGQPTLLDLGIPAVGGQGFAGTPGYAAPEQLGGAPPSPASDVYSFGVTLFVLLVGDGHPFSADACAQALVPSQRLPWVPGMLREAIPEALDATFFRLLHPRSLLRPAAACVPGLLAEAMESPAGTACPAVFGAWQAIGQWFRALHRRRGGAVLVLHGGDPDTLQRALAWLGRAFTAEGTPRLGLDQVPRAEAWLAAEASAWPQAAPWVRAGAGVILTADRPQQALVDEGVVHVLLPTRARRGAQTPAQRRVVAELAAGPRPVDALAVTLGLGALDLLDLCEPLLDEGVLVEIDDGAALQLSPSPAPAAGPR